MAGSKGIPSWQKESATEASKDTTINSLQNDDPVYAQAQASISKQPEASSSAENDDPVYAQAEALTSSSTDTQPSDDSATDPDPHLRSRSSLLASASKFLEHEDLRTASIERKAAFLEKKGLSKDEIEDLLQATTDTASPPPIITYPEFLLHAHRPKPLVTRTRIINAVYATGLISGTLYLANRYLFEPMAEQMAAARHELFQTAQQGVQNLNEQLEKNVSVIPAIKDSGEDAESVVSDPEELFHRDIGVQTSPKLEGEGGDGKEIANDTVDRHASKLQDLRTQIESLSDTGNDALEEDEATRSVVGDLQAYLEELAYGGRKAAFSWENGYSADGKRDSTKMDEIAKFKAEIRSVKGALLSARNFPSGSVRVR